jgi:hypothetical protein
LITSTIVKIKASGKVVSYANEKCALHMFRRSSRSYKLNLFDE